ncbi:MAG: hypothetical protein AB1598_06890 [Thermodesulfobacteriota bacterium]
MTVKENPLERRNKINSILGYYTDFLKGLSDALEKRGNPLGYETVRARAFKLLDETLAGPELDGLLMIEGELRGRFPGVEHRIKELLRIGIEGPLDHRKY